MISTIRLFKMTFLLIIVCLVVRASAQTNDNLLVCSGKIQFLRQKPAPEASLYIRRGTFILSNRLTTDCEKANQCAHFCMNICDLCEVVTYDMLNVRMLSLCTIQFSQSYSYAILCFREIAHAVKFWERLPTRGVL